MASIETAAQSPFVEELTGREIEILALMAEGLSNPEIADRLVLSVNTVKWYARQIFGKLGVKGRRAAVARARELGSLSSSSGRNQILHNLPGQTTTFVGREMELRQLDEWLADPMCRFVTLIGPGGIGKTRLALQAAEQQVIFHADRYPHGIYFVSLGQTMESTAVVYAVSNGLQLALQMGNGDFEEQLLRHLREKRLLLILDNLEHLLDEELLGFLQRLSAVAPNVQTLVTSRTACGLHGEQLLVIDRLEIPSRSTVERSDDPLGTAQAYSAIQLLQQSAARVRPTWRLTETNLDAAIRICHAVDGLPLGIELAMGWLSTLSLAEIADEVGASLDVLSDDRPGVADRHRSLRAVFDRSWELLSDSERDSLLPLTVFRDGFDRRAAGNVAHATPRTLRALVNKSWLQRATGGRLALHELLRQYAADCLSQLSAEEAVIRQQHSRYYRSWIRQQEAEIKSPAHEDVLARIDVELENIKTACEYAVVHSDFYDVADAVGGCGQFYRWTCRYREGADFFTNLVRRFQAAQQQMTFSETDPTATQTALLLEASLWIWTGTFVGFLSDWRQAEMLLQQAKEILARPELSGMDTRREQAWLALQLGYGRLYTRPDVAYRWFQTSSKLFGAVGDVWELGCARLAIGRAARDRRQLPEARQATAASLALFQATGNVKGVSQAHNTLASIALYELDFTSVISSIADGQASRSPIDLDGHAVSLYYLGETYFWSGEFAAAAETFSACVRLREELGMDFFKAHALVDLATVALHEGNAEDAVEKARSADAVMSKPGSAHGVAYATLFGAHIALSEGEYRRAEHLYQKLLAARWLPEGDSQRASCEAGFGIARMALGEHDDAGQHLTRALETAVNRRELPPALLALYGMADLFALRGESQRAGDLYALAASQPLATASRWFSQLGNQRSELREQVRPATWAIEDFWSTAAGYCNSIREYWL